MYAGRILLATDTPANARQLGDTLEAHGHAVQTVARGDEALAVLERERPDLVVLDLLHARMDGFETLRAMRRVSATPVILLTPQGHDGEILRGFASGADDCLPAPCNPEELAARAGAVLSRMRSAHPRTRVLRYPRLAIDPERRNVTVDGAEVHLTATEWQLLALLAANVGTVMRHSELLWPIWGPEHGEDTGYLRTWISRIRAKIEPPGTGSLITTYNGIGYRLAAPPAPDAPPRVTDLAMADARD